MFNRSLLSSLLFCLVLTCSIAVAQNLCPPGVKSDKLVCLIPQVFGSNGLQVANPDATGEFQVNFLSTSLQPLTSAIARQAALLPLASPSSGITFSWDPAAKVFIPSIGSLGPILGDRADTIGKYQVALAFDYQYFKFDTIDGIDLKNLPVVLTQPDFNLNGVTCSLNAPSNNPNPSPISNGPCSFIRDVVVTSNRLDLKIHQFTTFITFGLTNRIDVSVAIPIENVRMGVFSTATIMKNSFGFPVHAFPQTDSCGAPCFHSSFPNVGTASGIGDITLRVKGKVWTNKGTGEQAGSEATASGKAALALGVDIRVPTGDGLNFLGAGTAGVKPFLVWSYRSRIAPHAFVGYETNGSSVLAGDVLTGQKERFPGQLTYSGGADVWATKWLTVAVDLLGQQVFQAQRTAITTFTEPGACTNIACSPPKLANVDQNLLQSTGTFNITNASVGLKAKPFSTLLITGNVLIKMNDGGLRASVVPLVGLSYAF